MQQERATFRGSFVSLGVWLFAILCLVLPGVVLVQVGGVAGIQALLVFGGLVLLRVLFVLPLFLGAGAVLGLIAQVLWPTTGRRAEVTWRTVGWFLLVLALSALFWFAAPMSWDHGEWARWAGFACTGAAFGLRARRRMRRAPARLGEQADRMRRRW